MIVFLLVVYMGAGIISQTQTFADVDRCLYIANRLNNQPAISTATGKRVKMKAICKPVIR
jgi:hypothetical protein